MSKHALFSVLAGLVLAGAGSLYAADVAVTEQTLKGTMECAKCELHQTSTCQNVLDVKDGDKDVLYYLVDNKVSKDFHKGVCTAPKADVSVTGVVSEKDGKHLIEASKIEG